MIATEHGTSFEHWAAEYDRYRPSYPPTLFEEIATRLELPEHPAVADLGAGTGLATFAMADVGWRVTAVEPAARMLDVLSHRAASREMEIAIVEANAEATGLPDASVDLATAAQSFHWFDRPKAVREMARVVRPGGGVALFWNVRDAARSPLVADYERLVRRYFGDAGIGQYLQHGQAAEAAATRAAFAACGGFSGLTHTEPRHAIEMVAEDFVGMAFTASYVRKLPADEQARFRDAIHRILARHAADQAPFIIPYRIDLWTARRMDR